MQGCLGPVRFYPNDGPHRSSLEVTTNPNNYPKMEAPVKPQPIRSMFYGIVTNTKGIMKYLGCDDASGGYPYISDYPVIHLDSKYLESHKNDSYLNKIVDGGKYTLRIYAVNPILNTITEVM